MNTKNLITEFVPGGLRLRVPLLNGQVFLLTPQKNWAKYISKPHYGVKPQKLCSDQKTNTTTAFVASFYLKMTISMPQSNSDTFGPPRHLYLNFHATAPAIND